VIEAGEIDESRDGAILPRLEPKTGATSLKQLFRAAAKAVIQTLAPSPAKRRRRTDDTQGAFKLARVIVSRVKRAIFEPWEISSRVPTPHDEAEYFLRRLLDEWADADNDHAQEQDAGFHYASNADFDPQP
jgi:hypothetical protein